MSRPVEFEPREPLLLVGIRTTYEHLDTLEAVQYAWPVDPEYAKHFPLVLAVSDSVVRGVYRRCGEWLEATRENFPHRDPHPGRWGFNGCEAESEEWDYYVGKRVPDRCRLYGPVGYYPRRRQPREAGT